MSTKKWKNQELKSLLSEAWGFKMDLSKLNEERTGSGVDHGGDDDAEAKEETEGRADSKRELEETGAKRSGASKDDKGKDPDDPDARDYEHDGDRKGDDSETRRGKDYMNEESGEEEKRHYEDNAWNDEDHIEAIEKHLRALKKDRDYDEDHEALEEDGAKRKGDPRLRRPDADRLRESVVKLHKAGLSESQIKKFLTASISKVFKG